MVNTQIWDLRKYEENVVKYPKLNEIKETLLNDGLVAIPYRDSLWAWCERKK